jgi:DNA mismatch repair protein MutL
MGNAIQPLNTELIYRIAAGEIIDSVGAVVRELIDNALDASATRITISLGADLSKVEVADNGAGLTWVNLQNAALPHTTSKISTFAHLSDLHTLGFRGEALHSLAQLGRLEICSRAQASPTGWRILYDTQGVVVHAEEVAMAAGTTVTVTHLFETWPSRQQDAIAKASQWLSNIQAMIGDYALCHPHITWQAYHDHRQWFNLAPGHSAKDAILQLIGKLTPEDLRYEAFSVRVPDAATNSGNASVKTQSYLPSAATLEVLVGLPDRYHRHRPDWVRVAVNGRRVSANGSSTAEQWGPLEQSILNAFRQALPRHRHPLCWIHLKVPAHFVDWNRTASKSHIYLHEIEPWKQQIAQCIQQVLNLSTLPDASGLQMRQFLKTAEAKGRYALATPLNLSAQLPHASPTDEPAAQDADNLKLGTLRAIAQLHQTYIVAEHPSGLWLVEQHIAHERVLYEQLCQDWQFIDLDTPLALQRLSDLQIQNLAHLGLPAEPFGPDLWAVRTAPKLLAQRPDCLQALYELSHCADPQPALAATACRSALRNGQTLTLSEMQILLNQWQQTQHPRTCPHGRPIYLRLEEQTLAKFFRRHWVIGKSHGI